MEVFHITCLGTALEICRTRTWKFADAGGDEGINLFDRRGGFTNGNLYTHTGVRLVFDWLGTPPVRPSNDEMHLNSKDTLYDQYPWRIFLSPNLSGSLLRINRIELVNIDGECCRCGKAVPVASLANLFERWRRYEISKKVSRQNRALLKHDHFIERVAQHVDFLPER